MKTRLLFAAAIAAGLAFVPAAFAEDAMSKPGMAKDTKMDSKMDKKTDAMSKEPDKMQKPGTTMMDKKDSMSKDGMKK
jgi:pentapeptide MXKDX repeat protein